MRVTMAEEMKLTDDQISDLALDLEYAVMSYLWQKL